MADEQTVLVVDDDPAIVALMRDFLEAERFLVATACDAAAAERLLDERPVDCLVLDVMMPGESGFELCRRLRRTSEVPIIFLSARDDHVDKIRGLGLGGDDYIVKSATPAEVVARVKAVLRRYRRPEAEASARLEFGRLSIDPRSREVWLDGQAVTLTPREFEILLLLATHPRQVFTYDQILEHCWDGIGERHTVTVNVGRLREKLGDDPGEPELIVNVWGVGYRFEGRPAG
jgi:DNA-binding response OmpR family regulator